MACCRVKLAVAVLFLDLLVATHAITDLQLLNSSQVCAFRRVVFLVYKINFSFADNVRLRLELN